MQVPPQVSAVKVDGERAYARARAGETLDLAARPLTVERLDLVAVPDPDTASFEMVCGKGGYVRSIARDLGQRLGCLGHVVALRRALVRSVRPRRRRSTGRPSTARPARRTLAARLLPVRAALGGLPELACPAAAAAAAAERQPGAARPAPASPRAPPPGRASATPPVAVGTWRGGALHPTRVFALP